MVTMETSVSFRLPQVFKNQKFKKLVFVSGAVFFVSPGFYFDSMEITPPAVGVHLFGPDDNQVDRQTYDDDKDEGNGKNGPTCVTASSDLLWQVSSLSPQMEVRALVEGQFLSRRLYAERLGYSISKLLPLSAQH